METGSETIAAETTAAGNPPAADAELAQGDALGRYVVLARLGAGGMGAVYAAYDPRLDRKVAVKVLRKGVAAGDEASARLVREAQAMAKLTHPNVVTVFDAGVDRGRLFIAMELVDGTTLSRWLGAAPRSWRSVVDVLSRAGAGLAAAHAQQIVHRDFKPDNVMIASDGRVLVMDFGLAYAGMPTSASAGAPTSAESKATASSTELTAAGALLGTPAYMAPEQFAGVGADARSDQFSFCVALYEALFDRRPFVADSLGALALVVTEGRVIPPPIDSRVPAWLRRIVLRGLSVDPAARFASMQELLTALAADPSRRRRRILGRGVVIAAVAIAGWSLLRADEHAELPCGGANERLAGVWDAERRRALDEQVSGASLGYAADAWHGAADVLDAYANAWIQMRREACEATRVRFEQSESLLDLRMRCLERRRAELDTAVSLMAALDPSTFERDVQAAWNLTPVDGCADVEQLTATVPLPEDPRVRESVGAIEVSIAQATALERAARYDEGLALARAVVVNAEALGHPPLVAEARFRLARLLDRTGELSSAREAYGDAVRAAALGHHDEVVATSYADLAFLVGYGMARPDEGLLLADVAESAVLRIGSPRELRGKIANTRGAIHDRKGEYEQALAAFELAVELWRADLGDRHPRVGAMLGNVGSMLYRLGRYEEALAHYRRALEIAESAYGPDHPEAARQLANIGLALRFLGRDEEALPVLERALSIRERALGPDHPEVAATLASLAGTLNRLERVDEAIATYRRAIAIQEVALGPDHIDLALSLHNAANALERSKRFDEALAMQRRALAILEARVAPGHPHLGYAHHGVGTALLALGRPEEAIPELLAAMSVHDVTATDPTVPASTKFALARALWSVGRERRRALELARQAATMLVGTRDAGERETIVAWIAEREAKGKTRD